MVIILHGKVTKELALFRREAIDGTRVTGVIRAVIEDDLSITFIIKTALVASLFSI